MTSRYPNLTRDSLRVLLTAAPSAEITPAIVAEATGNAENFAAVVEDLNRAHMLDPSGELTPLADNYARICRASFRRNDTR